MAHAEMQQALSLKETGSSSVSLHPEGLNYPNAPDGSNTTGFCCSGELGEGKAGVVTRSET